MSARDRNTFNILRLVSGLNTNQAAKKIGVCWKTMAKLRNGETNYPSGGTMHKALDAFNAEFVIRSKSTGELLVEHEEPKRRITRNRQGRASRMYLS
jgi:DNA-binding XRE family transcriptional regulator